MTELELIQLWNKSRNQLIFAQLAPTFLLITTAGLVSTLKEYGNYTIWAVIGILLASGILGALAKSRIGQTIVKVSPWLNVAKYLTPAIFVVIFITLVLALI
jgi:CDP-diglyceride synthetase